MFGNSDLSILSKIFGDYHATIDRLRKFLEPIAHDLHYHDISDIDVQNNTIGFAAEWFGPYQAYNKSWFELPLDMLKEQPDVIVGYLRVKGEVR